MLRICYWGLNNMKNSDSHPIRISEINLGSKKLGLSFCPGKFQPNALSGAWNRSLDKDLKKIKNQGYDIIVSLIEGQEFEDLQVNELQNGAVDNFEMKWIWAPIVDGDVPIKPEAFIGLNSVIDLLESEHSIFVHCKGGLGRAGTIAAWLLTHNGRTAEDAITEIRKVRKGAIENSKQYDWIKMNSRKRLV